MLLTIAFILGAILSIFYAFFSHHRRRSATRRLPPGPIGLPIVGCIPYISSRTVHLTLKKWRHQYGPLFSFYMADRMIVVLGDSPIVREALVKQGDIFNGRNTRIRALRAEGKPRDIGLSTAEGELWREQRRFCMKVLRDFGAGRSILEPKIRREDEYLCEQIRNQARRPFDIAPFVHYAVGNIIVEFVFGRRFLHDDPVFTDYLSMIKYRLSGSGLNDFSAHNYLPWLLKFPTYSTTVKKVNEDGAKMLSFLSDCIEEKKRTWLAAEDSKSVDRRTTTTVDLSPDYVSAFLEAQASGEGKYFHDDQLLVSVQQLFIAGSETTATTLRWALWFLCHHRDVQEKIYDEIERIVGVRDDEQSSLTWADRSNVPYTEAFICEVERIRTVAPLSLTHRTLEETTLRGYHIPRDSYVIPLAWAVHRHPAYFPEPDEFRPERFLDSDGKFVKNDGFMPFGVGPRVCLGESLAKMEVFLFLTSLVQRFRFLFPSGGDGYESQEPTVGVVISPEPFEMIAEER